MCGNCHYPVMVTGTKIKTAKPTDKPFKLYDEDGLFIIVKPNGLRWWHWCHTFDGKAPSFYELFAKSIF